MTQHADNRKKSVALAADLNKLRASVTEYTEYCRRFNGTLWRYGIDPQAGTSDDVRHVGGKWWVRFDPRLQKWRAIESEAQPPNIRYQVSEGEMRALQASGLARMVDENKVPYKIIDPTPDSPDVGNP